MVGPLISQSYQNQLPIIWDAHNGDAGHSQKIKNPG